MPLERTAMRLLRLRTSLLTLQSCVVRFLRNAIASFFQSVLGEATFHDASPDCADLHLLLGGLV